MGWAVVNWIYLEGRAIKDNLIRSGSLLSYEPTLFLSYVESIVREIDNEHLSDLYLPPEDKKAQRLREIRDLEAAFA
jgi:hypothetical protein